jgi:predicted nucleotidyltransferase
MSTTAIDIPIEQIAEICERFHDVDFSLLGSVLRDDFRADSDIDVLVTFHPEARTSLFDLVDLQEELKALFGREVDVITRPGIEQSENYIRKSAILGSAQQIYVAR